MFINCGSFQLEYPIKVWNLYNLREEDYKILVELFYKKFDLQALNEKIRFLKSDIIKTGREKVYLNVLRTRRIGIYKKISPRQFLKNARDEIRFFDKHYFKEHKKDLVRPWLKDKEVAELLMSKWYFNMWIDMISKNSYCIRYFRDSKRILFWYVTTFLINDDTV